MMRHLAWMVVCVVLVACGVCRGQVCEPTWDRGLHTSGFVGAAFVMRTFELPGDAGPTLYAAGYFTSIQGANTRHVAKRVNGEWRPLGLDLDAQVRDLAVFDDGQGAALYAIGSFTGRIAKWDGSMWTDVGGGLGNGFGKALIVHDDGSGPALYATGTFQTAGGVIANRIARWRGAGWEALGEGLTFPSYAPSLVGGYSLLSHEGRLYVGGTFDTAGGVAARNVAVWNGTAFEALGAGLEGPTEPIAVLDLMPAEDGGVGVIAAGNFTRSGGESMIGVASWDGKTWTQVGQAIGTSGEVTVRTLEWIDEEGTRRVVAGGRLCRTCQERSHVRVLRDGVWELLGGGVDASVHAVHQGAGGLYLAGEFAFAGDEYCGRFAVLDGGAWRAAAPGAGMGWQFAYADVYSLAMFNDGTGNGEQMYAGGGFRAAGTTPASFIARWDGSRWHGVGGGLRRLIGSSNEDGVWDMQAFDDGSGAALFVGGSFTASQTEPIDNIAKWDGVAWSPLGTGSQAIVRALEVFDEGGGPSLYATGYIEVAEGGTRLVARWDGSAWRGVGGPITGQHLRAMAVYDDQTGNGPELYVGGRITAADGVPVVNVAKWNGVRWAACGAGLGAPGEFVWELTVIDLGEGPVLYGMGGFFSPRGLNVRRWTGSQWEPVGAFAETPFALTAFDDGTGPALYCGSYSRSEYSAEDPRNSLWKFVGSEWQQYAGGTYRDVHALLAVPPARAGHNLGGSLWLGGGLLSVGSQTPYGLGVPSSRVARLEGCAPCPPDWDGDGGVNSADVFLFLEEFFSSDTDFDRDGQTTSADFFAFIAAWFGGC